MSKVLSFCVSALTLFLIQSAQANVEVDFVESAPKDRFVVKNIGECNLQDFILEIDLRQSAGRLIFDTTATGAGVDVFQPFEVREGSIKLISSGGVKDGDTALSLSIQSLPSGKAVSFTIDVDDTLPVSELGKIRVSGSEIENGLVKIILGEAQPATGVFSRNSKAIVLLPPCSSS